MTTVFPVVMPTAGSGNNLSGKEKIIFLRNAAREALKFSAKKSGVKFRGVKKDKKGVPLPFDGNFWSVSHKPKCVAAVIDREKIGIDIEEIIPRPAALFSYLATKAEWDLFKKKDREAFFRYWTAKEAVLKSVGKGIGEFKKCLVVSILNDNHLSLEYGDHLFRIEQINYQNHIISVVKNHNRIEWIIPHS